MQQYKISLVDDGPEYYWIKRILERNNDQTYLVDRAIAWSLITAYSGRKLYRAYTYLSTNDRGEKAHIEAWQAFFNGDRSLVQNLIETHRIGTDAMRAAAKEELSDPNVRLRILIYVIITLVIVVGAFKVFRVF